MTKLPVVFISHGPPLIAVTSCPANRFLKRLGAKISKPRAILSISAHWESINPLITLGDHPEILYDFGEPRVLRQMPYPLAGAPWLTEEVLRVLNEQGLNAQGMERGFDHGTWIPLSLMYPQADIPVVQLSIQTEANAVQHMQLGRALSPLRKSDVLILASGGAVHNIDEAGEHAIDADPPAYAYRFDRWLEKHLLSDQTAALLDFRRQAPQSRRCHPYPHEHLLPLFVAVGAGKGAYARRLHDSFMFGTLSMAAYAWE